MNLATVLYALGRYDEAERECRGNLEISRAVSGNESEHTLTTLATLAVILANNGKIEESLPIAKEALDLRRRIMGNDHTDTLRSVFAYGGFLMKLERFEEARPLMEEALDGHRRLKGPDHAHTLYIESTCAVLYAELGLVEKAQTTAKDALERARAGLGEDDPRVGRMFGTYGFALIHAKCYEEAESALLEAHGRLEGVYGAEHINTRNVVRHLALLYERWHETELDGGHDVQAAEWQAKLGIAYK